MHLAGRPHLAGMSTAFRLDFASPTIYRDLQTLESWPHPQTASVLPNYPISLSTFSWVSSSQPPKATHRMWLTMDLPLLCNVYSVLFAKYESLSCLLRG